MSPLLLALNIVVWLGVAAYLFRLLPPALARRWNLWLALVGVLGAAALSFFSYRGAEKAQVQKRFRDHYVTGIGERESGNLEAAEREFEAALAVQPDNPEARKQLEEIRQQKPAEKREQTKETRVEPAPEGTPGAGAAAQNAPPAGSNTPPNGAPAQQNKPGEKPKPAPHLNSPFEITHYALEVRLDPAAHTLDGTATIQVRSRGTRVPVLDFSLNPEFKATAVQYNNTPAPFQHTKDLLAVTPAQPLEANGKATLTVRYSRKGEPLVQGGDLISEEGTYLRSEARWYPATGELDFRSPVKVVATVPKGYMVVSVGQLRNTQRDAKTVTYHWETDRFASMVSLAAAKYVQKAVRVPLAAAAQSPGRGELKVTCYTFPEHQNRADAFLKEAATIVRFYERRFGPYPYEKLGVVEIPMFPGGYGTTSFVMLIDQAFAEKKVDREFLAHEIAHQWWGNSVFPQGLGAAWLTEAFANYSAWMYDAEVRGNQRVLQKRVQKATSTFFRDTAAKGDQAINETDPYAPVGARDAILYEKGAVVLHMLRRQVGDAAFLKVMRGFADRYRFGKAYIADFRQMAEKESGQKLDWFFDQWLNRTGGAQLSYRFATEPDTPTQNAAVLTITQPEPAYRARLRVTLDVEGAVQTHEIELTQAQQEFRFPIKGKLSTVLLDPDNTLLMKPPRWVVQ